MASVSEDVGAFQEQFGGEVVVPSDPGYHEARSVWNGDIDRRPADFEFDFDLHEVNPLAHLGLFFWGVDQGVDALGLARDTVVALPENVGALIAGLSAPPAPFVPQEHQFQPGFALLIASFGSPEEHAELIAPVRDALAPLFELVTRSRTCSCRGCSTRATSGAGTPMRRRSTSTSCPTRRST